MDLTYVENKTDLIINKLSRQMYKELKLSSAINDDEIYLIDDDGIIDAGGGRIISVAAPEVSSDAVNKAYVDSISAAVPTKVSQLTNDSGFTTNVGTITGIKMNGSSKGTSGVVDLGTILTSHQSLDNYYTKVQTNALSTTFRNGLATTNSLTDYETKTDHNADVNVLSNEISSKVLVDGTSMKQLELKNISIEDYAQLLKDGQALSNCFYVVSSDNLDAEGERLLNVADPEEDTDAANKAYVDAVSSVVPTKVSQLTNDSGYLTEHQSLADYYKKNETSSNSQIKTVIDSLDNKFIHISGDSNIGNLQLSGYLNVGNNTIISKSANAIGTNNIVGQKAWYYSAIDFTNKVVYLTDDISKRINGSTTLNSSFQSGFAVGDIISFVNDSKYDRKSKVTAVNGNKITVDSLPFNSIVAGKSDYDDYVIFSNNKSAFGCVDLGECSYSVGVANKAFGKDSTAFGLSTEAFGNYSFTEGRDTHAGYASHAEGRATYAIGIYSHTEGYETSAFGDVSHSEGISSIAYSGYGTHAEGYNTKAIGESTHTEGYITKAILQASHAEGRETIANGINSHVEGYKTLTENNNAHAEGESTIAKGIASHAEGISSIANVDYSHAEGYNTKAYGWSSHAEGSASQTNASNSHAEGRLTNASGYASHTEGCETIANNKAEHAEGNYNKSNKNSDNVGDSKNTLHSVGIGTSATDRKNAFEIMQNGDIYVKGIGGYDGTNATASTSNTIQTAVQPKYVLSTLNLTYNSSTSQYTGQLSNYAIITVIPQSNTTIKLVFPTKETAGTFARDFIVRLDLTTYNPTVLFAADSSSSETISYESEDDEWASFESGINVVSFTETYRNGSITKFMVSKKVFA